MSDFLYRFSPAFTSGICEKLDGLKSNLSMRFRNVEKLMNFFTGAQDWIRPLDSGIDGVPWRFNLWIERGRNALLKHLLAKGYKISSWHPPADIFFRKRNKNSISTPLSDRLGDHIMNIWVNEEIDDHYITDIGYEILQFDPGRQWVKTIPTG